MRRHENPRLGVAGALNKNQYPAGISASPSLVQPHANHTPPLPRPEHEAGEARCCRPS
jgi:hypothetical protein